MLNNAYSMSSRMIANIVGVLFLTSTIAFAAGVAFIEPFVLGENLDKAPLIAGILLEVYCGVAVAFIGLLMRPVLGVFSQKLALWYAVFRSFDLVFILANGAFLLIFSKLLQNYDLMIYASNGVGGLVLSWALLQARLVPRSLAVLGLFGYAVLLLGVPLEFVGSVNMDIGAGLLFYAPGGLFEFLLPVWLLAKGFNQPVTVPPLTQSKN